MRWWMTVTAGVVLGATATARAQEGAPEVEGGEEPRREITAAERERMLAVRLEALEERLKFLEEDRSKPGWLQALWANGLTFVSPDKAYSFVVGGRIMFDLNFIQEDRDIERTAGLGDQADGFQFRRARIHVMGTFDTRFEYRAEFDMQGANFRDVWIGVKKLPLLGDVRVGHHKEPFGLEELTSSRYITFIERSLTGAFIPAHNLGILFVGSHFGHLVTASAGIFRTTPDPSPSQGGDGEYAGTARVTTSPIFWDKGDTVLHLGGAWSHRIPPGDAITFAAKPEANMAGTYVTTGARPAESVNLYGAEFAFKWGPLSVQAEAICAYLAIRNATHNDYWAGYAMVSLFLTPGDARPYKRSAGTFDRVKPKAPLWDKANPGIGAIEIGLRCSTIDLNDLTFKGRRMNDTTLAVNWYLHANLRVMVDYIYSDLHAQKTPARLGGRTHILLVRFQVDF